MEYDIYSWPGHYKGPLSRFLEVAKEKEEVGGGGVSVVFPLRCFYADHEGEEFKGLVIQAEIDKDSPESTYVRVSFCRIAVFRMTLKQSEGCLEYLLLRALDAAFRFADCLDTMETDYDEERILVRAF